jgi:hypothetical protein
MITFNWAAASIGHASSAATKTMLRQAVRNAGRERIASIQGAM